ncbi:MAG: hypothetical protein ACRERC_15215 [Candidatus Binatia bacterium]
MLAALGDFIEAELQLGKVVGDHDAWLMDIAVTTKWAEDAVDPDVCAVLDEDVRLHWRSVQDETLREEGRNELRGSRCSGAAIGNKRKRFNFEKRNKLLLQIFKDHTGGGARDYDRKESTEAYKAVAAAGCVGLKRAREIISEAREAEARSQRSAASR